MKLRTEPSPASGLSGYLRAISILAFVIAIAVLLPFFDFWSPGAGKMQAGATRKSLGGLVATLIGPGVMPLLFALLAAGSFVGWNFKVVST